MGVEIAGRPPTMHVDASVIVCTFNRAASVARSLAAMERLELPDRCSWELLVVNNASTDDTPAVLATIAGRGILPLRVITEPQLGLSRARNAGVTAARGDLLLFTDDDTVVDPCWLGAYLAAARRWPHASYFGGPVDPLFESVSPRWIRENLEALSPMLCRVEVSGDERPITQSEQPFGPNMAFRRQGFLGVSFNEEVGRRGAEQIRGSEVSVTDQLKRAGATGVWVPTARVQHVIPSSHATLRYLVGYQSGAGATAVRLHPFESGAVNVPYRIAKGMTATAWTLVVGRRDWVVHLGRTAYYLGLFRERIRTRRQ
jgi:hypothetical protein